MLAFPVAGKFVKKNPGETVVVPIYNHCTCTGWTVHDDDDDDGGSDSNFI